MNSKTQKAQAIAATVTAVAINGTVLHAAIDMSNQSWQVTE